ncbi:DUF791-domain-containing protein [Vararia minispora EC-137]|uniref:DUF791-domain-containing protein n=1 Tax=Vararia minispora EC-137 TaxID=1314806 RepID=A0ACB8QVZ0_9AGAM|nr:DUF791-domain-containing protein [Vararia minispora EC-137]
MGFYDFQFGFLGTLCACLQIFEHYYARLSKPKANATTANASRDVAFSALMRKYLAVYGLVMSADWLQGPYAYSLYAEQYAYTERVISYFFITGFLSGGLFAPLMGSWADQYGRKRMCQMFCVLYAGSCVFLQFSWLPSILLARILGGIATSILFSVFESWLVSSHSEAGLSGEDLSTILGRATVLNGFVATVAGVFANKLVDVTGQSFRAPFVASALVLVIAGIVLSSTWHENYGAVNNRGSDDNLQLARLYAATRVVLQDPTLLILCLTQTIFEGSMYLFVFIWVPTLQESSTHPNDLPLGYIFSNFMVSVMLGSLLYTFITVHWCKTSKHDSLALHVTLSSLLCGVSALVFAICVNTGKGRDSVRESTRFWAFCAFEACVGMYYPVQGALRGSLIANEHRATLSALFRVPLNIFVVVALATGFSHAREMVLFACSLLLAFSAITSAAVLLPRIENTAPASSHMPLPQHNPE